MGVSLFSEMEIGWTTGQGSQMLQDPVSRKRVRDDVDMDACALCSGYEPALQAAGKQPDYGHIAELETADLDWRVRQAERVADKDYQAWKAQQETRPGSE